MSYIKLPVSGGGGGLSSTLSDGNIFVGNGSDVATGVTPSGQVALSNTGVFSLVGVTDGSAASSGDIGEVDTAEVATPTGTGVAASSNWGDVASINLSAGAWMISAVAGFKENGAELTTSLSCAISDSATGVGLSALDYTEYNQLISGSADLVAPTPVKFVDISSTTTYYLNTRFYYNSGSPQHYGRIYAVRIR